MLRRLSYLLVLSVAFSCYGNGPLLTPDDDTGSPRTSVEPADAFVGTYEYEATSTLEMDGETATFTDSGNMWITKTGSASVAMFGAWEAFGDVSGNSIFFEDSMDAISGDVMTYTFPSAVLEGDVLTIEYEGLGYMRFGWHTRSVKESGTIVATKVSDTP